MSTSELRKALTASNGTALHPEDLEPVIRANLLTKSPLMAQMPLIKASGLTHTVVRRTANIAAAFEGDTAAPSYSQSSYARRNVTVKVLRAHKYACGL